MRGGGDAASGGKPFKRLERKFWAKAFAFAERRRKTGPAANRRARGRKSSRGAGRGEFHTGCGLFFMFQRVFAGIPLGEDLSAGIPSGRIASGRSQYADILAYGGIECKTNAGFPGLRIEPGAMK